VYPSTPTSVVFLYTAELDELIRKATVPAGMKAGRKPPTKRPKSS